MLSITHTHQILHHLLCIVTEVINKIYIKLKILAIELFIVVWTFNFFVGEAEIEFPEGVLHPIQKLACFVLYLKIINTCLKKNTHIISYSKLSKELKNSFVI